MRKTRIVPITLAAAMFVSVWCIRAQDWPQWRGPNRDNRLVGFMAPTTWPKELEQKWKVKVGIGESSPILVGAKVYTFSRQGDEETTLCLDAATGKEVWKDRYVAKKVDGGAVPHPGTRSTPAVGDGKVLTFGVGSVFSCLDAATGKIVWRKESTVWPQFFTSTSPIIVDGKAIISAGKSGKGNISAYDLASGEPKWEWNTEGPPHGSPALMTVGATKLLVTPAEKSIVGIDVADGKQLWKYAISAQMNNSGTPIIDGDKIYFTGPQAGTVALKVTKTDDVFSVTELWKKSQSSHQYNTPVLRDGALFGLSNSRYFYCMNAENGDLLWTDKATKRGECGTIIDGGSVLIALTSDTNLVFFEPSKNAYKELAKYQVSDNDTWPIPIISGRNIYVKDHDSLALWVLP